MDRKAIQKARSRLRSAAEAVHAMESDAPDLPRFEAEWWKFLVASSSIYATLEQGSKSNSRSVAWFGHRKHERRTDPLLRYIHHARNTEEHSLTGSTDRSRMRIKAMNKHIKIIDRGPNNPPLLTGTTGPEPGRFKVLPPGVWLLPVTDDRYHDTFHPPKEHLGKPITYPNPVTVAKLAIAYIQGMIDEADTLVI
jgi:hypothetical protein